ncbi:hypothetical protein AOLI_G00215360 [Acnodon oligacanthus]
MLRDSNSFSQRSFTVLHNCSLSSKGTLGTVVLEPEKLLSHTYQHNLYLRGVHGVHSQGASAVWREKCRQLKSVRGAEWSSLGEVNKTNTLWKELMIPSLAPELPSISVL